MIAASQVIKYLINFDKIFTKYTFSLHHKSQIDQSFLQEQISGHALLLDQERNQWFNGLSVDRRKI